MCIRDSIQIGGYIGKDDEAFFGEHFGRFDRCCVVRQKIFTVVDDFDFHPIAVAGCSGEPGNADGFFSLGGSGHGPRIIGENAVRATPTPRSKDSARKGAEASYDGGIRACAAQKVRVARMSPSFQTRMETNEDEWPQMSAPFVAIRLRNHQRLSQFMPLPYSSLESGVGDWAAWNAVRWSCSSRLEWRRFTSVIAAVAS